MIRLLLIDVDGTLGGRNGVHPSTCGALEAARRSGVHLGLCTGRIGVGSALAYAKQVAPNGLHVFQSGAVVARPVEPAAFASMLPDHAFSELVALARRTQHPLEAYTETGFFLECETDLAHVHARQLETVPVVCDLLALAEPVVSAVWVGPEQDWSHFRSLASPVAGLDLSPATVPWSPGTIFANFTRSGTSKASALRWLARHYGLEAAVVAMIGDGENDLGTLAAAGLAVAMGNVPASVKAQAHVVVGTAETGGLAEALRLVLAGHQGKEQIAAPTPCRFTSKKTR